MSKPAPKTMPFERSKLPIYEVSADNLVTSYCQLLTLEERDFFCDVVLQKKHPALGDKWLSLTKDLVLFYKSLVSAMEDAKKTQQFQATTLIKPVVTTSQKRSMSAAQLQQEQMLEKRQKFLQEQEKLQQAQSKSSTTTEEKK